MRLARIKNKYMYDCSAWRTMSKEQRAKNPGLDPNGEHWYALFTERGKSGKLEYRAVQINHLYKIDKNRQNKLNSGHYQKEKFAIYETPSIVENKYYFKDSAGNKIDISNKNVREITKKHLSSKQSKRIKEFAHSPRKR